MLDVGALPAADALFVGPGGVGVDGSGAAHCVRAAGAGAVTLTTVRRGGRLPAGFEDASFAGGWGS